MIWLWNNLLECSGRLFSFFFFVLSKLWETRDSLELSTKEAIRFIRRGQKSSPCKPTLEIHPCSHTDTLGLIAVRCGSPFSQPVIKSSPAQKGVDGDVEFGRCSLYRRMMKTFSPRLRPTVALPCFCFVLSYFLVCRSNHLCLRLERLSGRKGNEHFQTERASRPSSCEGHDRLMSENISEPHLIRYTVVLSLSTT